MGSVDAAALMAWFQHHRRCLPWRTPLPRDPYLVLVSEIMLQQTQVPRVTQWFPRFLHRFPSLEALAEATEEQVLASLTGLGYYRRARQLHQAAVLIAKNGWPQRPENLEAIPGLGPYTAAAVAAFSFGHLEPPVDGNLCRIAARFLASPQPAGTRALREAAKQFAHQLSLAARTPEVFEALMDLGALVCTVRNPSCSLCPLRPDCRAAAVNPTAYPARQPKRARESHVWVLLWVENFFGEVLVRKLTTPPLADLWLPPMDRGEGEAEVRALALAQNLGLFQAPVSAGTVKHHITRFTITAHVFVLPTALGVCEAKDGFRWVHPREPFPTSSLFAKVAGLVKINHKDTWEDYAHS